MPFLLTFLPNAGNLKENFLSESWTSRIWVPWNYNAGHSSWTFLASGSYELSLNHRSYLSHFCKSKLIILFPCGYISLYSRTEKCKVLREEPNALYTTGGTNSLLPSNVIYSKSKYKHVLYTCTALMSLPAPLFHVLLMMVVWDRY